MKKFKSLIEVAPMLVSCLLFGGSYMAVKLGVSTVSTLTLLMWRFIFSFIALNLCVLFKIAKLNLKGKDLKPLLIIALFQPLLYFLSATYGIGMTTVSESGTIAACMPIVATALSGIILHEKPTKIQGIGIVISVIGVIIVGLVKGQSPSFSILGYILLIIAMASDSTHVIFVRKASEYSQFEKTYIMSLVGVIVFTCGAFIEHGVAGTVRDLVVLPFVNTRFLACVLYLAIGCQVLAFHLSNVAYSTLGVSKASSFSGVVTIVSVLTGVLIMKDEFTLKQGIGTALVIIGIYIANSKRMKKKQQLVVENKS